MEQEASVKRERQDQDVQAQEPSMKRERLGEGDAASVANEAVAALAKVRDMYIKLRNDAGGLGEDLPTPLPIEKKAQPKVEPKKDEKGGVFFELSDKRRVSLSTFRGKTYVDIREFYEKDGVLLPGKKGISLNMDQWETFKNLISSVDAELAK